jgi:hypothetical protein
MAVTYVRNQDTGVFEQVGPGGSTTDTTLTLSGRAADAAAVGSALTNYATAAFVNSQVITKVDKEDGKGLSSNDYTDAEKTKLAGIATGANKTVVDSALSSSSTNPVQNKVINTALSGKSDTDHKHATGDITSGTLAVARGGTGVTSNPSMLVNLGSTTAASVFTASPRPGVTGTLPVAQGGTGQTKAWTNGTVTSVNNTTVSSAQFAVFPYLNKAFIRLNILTPRVIGADDAEFIALPSIISTAHTALSCYNEIGYDIHCGISSVAGKGVYIMNCGTSSMPAGTRLYIAGWFSI